MTYLECLLAAGVVALLLDAFGTRRELRQERAARARATRRAQLVVNAFAAGAPLPPEAGPYRTPAEPAAAPVPDYTVWLVEDGSWHAVAKDGGGAVADSPLDALEELLAKEDENGEVQPPAPGRRLEDFVSISIDPSSPVQRIAYYESYEAVLRDFGPDSAEARGAAAMFRGGATSISIRRVDGEAPVMRPHQDYPPASPDFPFENIYDRLPVAAGAELDQVGVWLRTPRNPGEDDAAYRTRLHNEIPF